MSCLVPRKVILQSLQIMKKKLVVQRAYVTVSA